MRLRARLVTLGLAVLFVPVALSGAVVCNQQQLATLQPTAVDDTVYAASAGVPVPVAVLANDLVAANGSLSIIAVSSPSHGTAVLNSDKTISYTPSVLSQDSFTYTITDTVHPDLGSSTATVQVIPRTGFVITVECHGGGCLFKAAPSLDGLKAITWNFGDGSPAAGGSALAYHEYTREGAFTVVAHADYWNGSSAEGSLGITIVFQKVLAWTATVNGLGITVLADYDSLSSFPGGATGAVLHVSMGDNKSDCLYTCGTGPGTGTGMSCFPYCQPVGDAYYRSGTYPVRVSVTDSTGTTYNYAKYVTAVNSPPRPEFSVTRDDPGAWSYTFDPSASRDDFDINSDLPFRPHPYEWDFGDGTTATADAPVKQSHLYSQAGQYTATLHLTDAGGLDAFVAHTVDVVNAGPVAKIGVNCRVLDCTFTAAGTVDDGNDVRQYDWSFGDGTTASGITASKHYAAGCYTVTLKATDGGGAAGTATLTVTVGPPLFATAGGAVVDAHVQSYVVNSKPATSNGNLNGILEPGESAVVEPNWHTAASSQPVSVLATGLSTTDGQYANPSFQDYAGSYDISTGTSDCWTAGRCYVIRLDSNPGSRGPNAHNDITFQETYLANGQPTPGSPIRIHVGNSFTDVPQSHWSYAYVESLLHAGIAGATGGWSYSPNNILTRGQIAPWLVAAKYGSAFTPADCTTPPFTDVPCSNPNSKWIAQLKSDGIASGTGFAPDANLTRADMAVFLLEAKLGGAYAPPACQFDFGDAPCPQHPASAWISDLRRRNISTGCSPNEFCPDDAVDRAQAASFLVRGFDLNIASRMCFAPGYDVVQGHVPRPPIASLTFSPSPVVVGSTSTGTLTLGLATPNGVTVPLTIDNPAAASIPASVFVPSGMFSATFTVTPANVSVRTSTQITATYLGQTKTTQLDVCTLAPAISSQPSSRTIYNGTSTTLTVTAAGGGPLTYQWYQGTAPNPGIPIGSNSNSITVSPSVTTSYWVLVSNACSSTASTTATVSVCNYPVITTQPQADVIVSGAPTTLTVAVSGSGPFGYQWYEGAAGVTTTPVGSNSSTFTTPALTIAKSYWVRVTSTCNGTATVDSAAAAITPVTQITRRQLAAGSVNSQTSITASWTRPTQAGSLLVAVLSAGNNSAIGAFTAASGWTLANSYEWNNVKLAIYYYPNNPGGRTSETFTMAGFRDQVLQLVEYVGATQAPLDKTAFDGNNAPAAGGVVTTGTTASTSAAKEVVVTGLTTYAQTSFAGATNSFVKLDERGVLTHLTSAVHERMVTTTGAYGHTATVTSAEQWLGLTATFKSIDACTTAPAISAQPASSTINAGQSATLSVTASGGGLSYQWYQGAAPSTTTPVGTNASTLTVTPSATTSYWVRITNNCGTASSSTATVTVCAPAGISSQPASQTIASGGTATLSVTASGGGPFTYQWYAGSSGTTTTPVGINSSTYTTPALTATKTYWVRVTSSCNGTTSVNSTTATVTVTTVTPVARRQLAASTVQSMSSITTNWTQPTQGGSLLVAVISASDVAAIGAFTPPSGWLLANSYAWNNIKTSIYYYPNNPGGRTAETFAVPHFPDLALQLAEYTGIAASSPLDKTGFDGNNGVSAGTVTSGTTQTTAQSKELVITALTIYAPSTFTNPTSSFVKIDERAIGNNLTTAVHERIVSAAAAYGHAATTAANAQWVGLVATFKSADTSASATRPPSVLYASLNR